MSWLYDCIDCMTVWMQKLIMYSWWWSNFSLATSCEHASYKCISKRRWFTGLEGKWLRVTDERAKATSLKTAPVYINIYLVCELAWVCADVKMPESVFCMFVCMHACVHTLNATIQASKLLIQTTVEQKSINNTRVHSKNDVILVQRAGKWEGEKQQCWTPASKDIFSTKRNMRLFGLLWL